MIAAPLVLTIAATLAAPAAAQSWEGTATVTAYCSACNTPKGSNDGAYGPVQMGDCAADPKHWKKHARGQVEGRGTLRVRDTGGAIKGRARFDVWRGWKKKCDCNTFGVKRLRYRAVK